MASDMLNKQVDQNVVVKSNINKKDVVFYNPETAPFNIYGVYREGDRFVRLPSEVAKEVSDGVFYLCGETSGGRITFRTNSSYIAFSIEYGHLSKLPHMSLIGSVGFDVYGDDKHVGTVIPKFEMDSPYQYVCDFKENIERDYVIHFPPYSEVKSVKIGLQDGSILEEYKPYKDIKPIVYYGPSITQGGCCNHPGMTCQNLLSRWLSVDHVNLGFAGNAKGEERIAEYISGLEMSIFVYDYQENAPSREHLEKTHEKMFKIIRDKNKTLPIVILEQPQFSADREWHEQKQKIVRKTFDNAIKNGDKNVYYVSSDELLEVCGLDGSVDILHPTDLGYFSMAKALYKVLDKILKVKN